MNNLLKKIVWLIMLIPAVYLALAWKYIPDVVPMQFDLDGQPKRMGSKYELFALTVVLIFVSALVYLLLTNIYKIDPKKYAAENKGRLQRIAFAVTLFMAAIQCFIIYTVVKGTVKLEIGLIFSGVGLLLALIGNYMPNLKPNYFAGLRLPWTLENEDNWRKTHLIAGKLWFAGGLLLGVVCLFTPPIPSVIIFASILLVMIIIPCVYSYRLYKRQRN